MSGGDDINKTGAINIATEGGGLSIGNVIVPPCLVLINGAPKLTGRQWVIDKPVVTLGRMAPSDILIDEGGLSKSHARITNENGKISITDLGATNKTAINGKTLEPNVAYPLSDGDQVRAGAVLFKFLQKGILKESAEKARMKEELETARSIQSSLLPTQSEARYGSVLVGGRYRTASECGGDWWWHWSAGGKAFALIGDATGHGAGAALITSAARSAVATMEDDPSASLERVYTTLTRALYRCAGGAITMSAFIVEVSLEEGQLRYINASHLPAVWLPKRNAESLVWSELHFVSDQISDALGSANQNFTVCTSPAPTGMRLVLLTDGLTERKASAESRLSERAFNKMLIEAHAQNTASLTGFLDALMAKSDAAAGGTPQDDDITVVALDF